MSKCVDCLNLVREKQGPLEEAFYCSLGGNDSPKKSILLVDSVKEFDCKMFRDRNRSCTKCVNSRLVKKVADTGSVGELYCFDANCFEKIADPLSAATRCGYFKLAD